MVDQAKFAVTCVSSGKDMLFSEFCTPRVLESAKTFYNLWFNASTAMFYNDASWGKAEDLYYKIAPYKDQWGMLRLSSTEKRRLAAIIGLYVTSNAKKAPF